MCFHITSPSIHVNVPLAGRSDRLVAPVTHVRLQNGGLLIDENKEILHREGRLSEDTKDNNTKVPKSVIPKTEIPQSRKL